MLKHARGFGAWRWQFLRTSGRYSSSEVAKGGNSLAWAVGLKELSFNDVHTFVRTLMYTLIHWDEAKNRRNLRKHGLGFSAAAEIFSRPHLVRLDIRENYGEDRWIGVGWIGSMIGVVVFTMNESVDSDMSIIRILSARKATKREVALFEQEVKN